MLLDRINLIFLRDVLKFFCSFCVKMNTSSIFDALGSPIDREKSLALVEMFCKKNYDLLLKLYQERQKYYGGNGFFDLRPFGTINELKKYVDDSFKIAENKNKKKKYVFDSRNWRLYGRDVTFLPLDVKVAESLTKEERYKIYYIDPRFQFAIRYGVSDPKTEGKVHTQLDIVGKVDTTEINKKDVENNNKMQDFLRKEVVKSKLDNAHIFKSFANHYLGMMDKDDLLKIVKRLGNGDMVVPKDDIDVRIFNELTRESGRCIVCEKTSSTRCNRCKAWYCSSEHQKEDEQSHKKVCDKWNVLRQKMMVSLIKSAKNGNK